MARTTTYVTLTGTILADTGKAIKIRIDKVSGESLNESVEHWFPVSQLTKMFKDPNITGQDWIMAAEWICKEKELV